LIARLDVRALAFVAVALACVGGVASRVVLATLHPPVPLIIGKLSELRLGQSIGEATFDGFDDSVENATRLRLMQCHGPVFALPLALTAVTVAEIADRAYGKLDGYRKADVYQGKVYRDFSRFRRLITRSLVEYYYSESGFSVRFYAPADCNLPDAAYVACAKSLLGGLESGLGEEPD
jgi:hypothetical protein